jgi:hypothetical protein
VVVMRNAQSDSDSVILKRIEAVAGHRGILGRCQMTWDRFEG